MAKFGNQVKLAWLKGMEAIGKGASNLASNAHLKVTEINLESRRREILSEFPLRAQDLWQKGVVLPDPLGDMMAELNELDEKLSVLRAQRYARVEVTDADDEKPVEEEGAQAESAAPPEDAEDAKDKGEAAVGGEAAADTAIAPEGAADEAVNSAHNLTDESAACDASASDSVDTADIACDNDRVCVDTQAPAGASADAAEGVGTSTAEPQGEGDNA